ncbi:MAG TPA: sulfatase-like hydrolase/transferase [Candidatus Polarisedimenticolia bacterium]|nr:sulfatase-like hydrolase/transferase [Candidatus Polarisedimenticolia bacterium]
MSGHFRLRTLGWFLVVMCALLASSGEAAAQNNVLMIVLDDVGVDALGTYCLPPHVCPPLDFPATPNIDALKTSGVLFRNAWSNPICSPTRATLMTGRYGFRTGVRDITKPQIDSNPFDQGLPANELPRCESTLPEVLAMASPVPARAAVGKWHLSNTMNGGALGPNDSGFPHYTGAYSNLVNYFNWIKTIDGRVSPGTSVYSTTDNVNDASTWIGQQTGSWFLMLAFNAPHAPFQAPPVNLRSSARPLAGVDPGHLCDEMDHSNAARRQCYFSMIEAVDKEFGRLKTEIGQQVLDHTTIILLGDNGTPKEVCDDVYRPECAGHSKETVYQGGINVPVIISGAQVTDPDRETDALVNTTDLFTTVIELMTGSSPSTLNPGVVLDSESLVPILNATGAGTRQYAYSELLNAQAVRNSRYKLIRKSTFDTNPAPEEYYDLQSSEIDSNNLLLHLPLTAEQDSNLAALRDHLNSILSSPLHDCDGDEIIADQDKCDEVRNFVLDDEDPLTQHDYDEDGKGDACDDCPFVSNSPKNVPLVHVNYPNGGQIMNIGSTVTLTWSATDDCGGASISNVDLLLSRSGPDGPFTSIAAGIGNTGSYSWTVAAPPTGGSTAFLKVLAHNSVGNTGLDVSDSGFKIRWNAPICSSYCSDVGVRCTPTGFGPNNCCMHECSTDPTCTAPDPCPFNSCEGCF